MEEKWYIVISLDIGIVLKGMFFGEFAERMMDWVRHRALGLIPSAEGDFITSYSFSRIE